ncbi:hypothetical protein XANMN_23750 [Xanthomonas phaseoli pv. manihotis str. CIO151]|nr:hypothetical protein XANMN_23750 [Xanthomonas phaseoli pv. manihotis str. CIO151]
MGAPASEVGVDPDVRDAGLTANARRSRLLRWADILGLDPMSLRRTGMRTHKKTGRLATTGFDWCVRRPWTDGRLPMRQHAARRVRRSGRCSADRMR